MINTLIAVNMKSLMPRTEIPVFTGDFTTFRSFLTAFDSIIGSKLISKEEKLYYLSQHTANKPLEIVRACMEMPEGEGYSEARRTLEKRYGNAEKIASAYTDKIMNWPIIKPHEVEALDEFSILLTNCKNAVSRLQHLSLEIEHPKTMRSILSKLPFNIQEKWRRKADDIIERQSSIIKFSDLVSFVQDEARIANNPMFGRSFFSQTKGVENKRYQCNSVKIEGGKLQCWFCKENHILDLCEKLRALPYNQKMEFMKEKKLCYRCLRPNHIFKSCRKSNVCETCKQSHHTLLHKEADNHSTQENLAAAKVEINSVNDNASIKLKVVPIKVYATNGRVVETWAFLDDGSTATFCSEHLCEQLGISCSNENRIDLFLSTVRPRKEIFNSYKVSDLKISDVDGKNFIDLPTVFTLHNIPATRSDIITKKEISKWPHLKDVPLPDIKGSVEMLIGNNIQMATEPFEIIHSAKDNDPYAVRTRLGWVVCGAYNEAYTKDIKVNKIQLEEIHNLLIDIYNRDFNDLNETDNKYTENVSKWLSKVEQSCTLLDSNNYEMRLPKKNDDMFLPDSKGTFLRQLNILKNKFYKNESSKYEYVACVSEMIDDCAAKVQGFSLNDYLLSGTDLTNNSLKVLGKETCSAEIAKMFHQVYVPQSDRDYLSFFWWKDGYIESSPEVCGLAVHLFGAASSPSVTGCALRGTAAFCEWSYGWSNSFV